MLRVCKAPTDLLYIHALAAARMRTDSFFTLAELTKILGPRESAPVDKRHQDYDNFDRKWRDKDAQRPLTKGAMQDWIHEVLDMLGLDVKRYMRAEIGLYVLHQFTPQLIKRTNRAYTRQ